MNAMRDQHKRHQHHREGECPARKIGVVFGRWLMKRFSSARHRHASVKTFAAKAGGFVTGLRLNLNQGLQLGADRASEKNPAGDSCNAANRRSIRTLLMKVTYFVN